MPLAEVGGKVEVRKLPKTPRVSVEAVTSLPSRGPEFEEHPETTVGTITVHHLSWQLDCWI